MGQAERIDVLRLAERRRGVAGCPTETDCDSIPAPFLQKPERKFPCPERTCHIHLVRVLAADRPAANWDLRSVEIDGELLARESVVTFRSADDEVAHSVV